VPLKGLHAGHVPDHPGDPGAELTTLEVGGTVVARCRDGVGLPAVLAPRPFLHPISTLAGTVVTDAQPDDHRWHLGLSVALQDVAGANLWGGRTYVRDQGYTWRDDHGRQVHRGWQERSAGGFRQVLAWQGPSGATLLEELRTVAASPADLPGAWLVDLSFALRNPTSGPVELGSPATHGRAGAGYGGLFWRLPPTAAAGRVFTADTEGEAATHGSRAPWLACSVDGAAPFTVALCGRDEVTASDPWFVRVDDYPGLGSQLAAVDPVRLAPAGTVRRSFRALVADGVLDRADVQRVLTPGPVTG
jgi:hypothetical protein